MGELELQKLVVDSVRMGGGFAFKLANRFLVGIPDLFIKLPTFPSALYEVKIARISRDKKVAHYKISPLQWKTLDEYLMAGGVGGIISFAKMEKDWGLAVWSLEKNVQGSAHRFDHKLNAHVLLQRGIREQQIVNALKVSVEWQTR